MAKRGPKPKIDFEKLIQLYSEGLSDREIGRRLNVSKSTVNLWRRRLGLESKHKSKWHIYADKIVELRMKGLTIREIEEKLGIPYPSIQYWLIKRGLSPMKKKEKVNINVDELIKLYASGLGIKEIAETLGVKKQNVANLIIKLGIAHRHKALLDEGREKRKKIIEMINRNGYTTTSKVASTLGISVDSASEILNDLFHKGKIKKFKTTRRVGGAKYSWKCFFSGEVAKAKALYYIDEHKFIEKLASMVKIADRGMLKSFTTLLRNNIISDEGIALFHKLTRGGVNGK